MEAPDFDPTVFLAALTAGPIIAVFTFYGLKMHFEELRTGFEPAWSGRYMWSIQLFIWPLIGLGLNYWFFWNLMLILFGVFLTTTGTYLISRLLLPLLSARRQRQHQEPMD